MAQDLLLIRPGAFRLLLAALVFVSHMSRFNVGRFAVVLFFVLSGYWISDLWRRETGRHRYLIFAINRFLRIWPLYLVAVLISYMIFAHPLDLPTFTIFGVASTEGPRQLGVEWSLDIEAQFYVVAPLLATASIGPWVLPLTGLGWLIFSNFEVTNMLMYLPAFYAGIFLHRFRDAKLPIGSLTSLLSFALLTVVFLAHPITRGILITPLRTTDSTHSADILAFVWALPLLPYIASSLRCRSSRIDRHAGNLAFPFYLLHEVIILALRPVSFNKPLISIICVLSAILLYVLADIPIERIRHQLLGKFKRRSKFDPLNEEKVVILPES